MDYVFVPLLLLSSSNEFIHLVSSHGTMVTPTPRQPESLYWYQVGCMIGCKCSGGGKETYPSPESVGCENPASATLFQPEHLTWNIGDSSISSDAAASSKNDWNAYMPWRSPGSSIPLDSCGIASGFDPNASVQYPHIFASPGITQGMKGSELPVGEETIWEAGSVVEAGFRLVVNHGGGYQYRVCPKSNSVINEECFEKNPLNFADDSHIIRFYDDDKQKNDIVIGALSVSGEAVFPPNHAWRKLPIPACGCDLGDGCYAESTNAAYRSYDNPHGPAYGVCDTGLQFDAEYLHNGVWPDGYGYYVEDLGKGGMKKSNGGGECNHGNEDDCLAESNCLWYSSVEKTVCYSGKERNRKLMDKCGELTDQTSCEQEEYSKVCTWYPSKSICYYTGDQNEEIQKDKEYNDKQQNFGGQGTTAETKHRWAIFDKLIAPEEIGTYVLQWRWDNEQTPQIWTTCADIRVVTKKSAADDNEADSSSTPRISGTIKATTMSIFALIMTLLTL